MLREDMEFMNPVDEIDIEEAQQLIIEIFNDIPKENQSCFDEAYTAYKKSKEKDQKDEPARDENTSHIVLVFSGSGDIAGSVLVSLPRTSEDSRRGK
jgi:hypothetical protein